MKKEEPLGRIKTYIPEFDKALSGGIPERHITLVRGSAGTLKSAFCFNIVYNAIKEGYKAAYVTLEQTGSSMLQQIRSMGYDLDKIRIQNIADTTALFAGLSKVDKKNVDLVFIDIANIRHEVAKLAKSRSTRNDWFDIIAGILAKLKQQGMADIFVIDSLTALYALSNFKEPRKDIFHIFSVIKEAGATSFLVSEITPETNTFTDFGIEDYLSDGIIHLGTARREMRVMGELCCIKMRSTQINKDVFIIEYKDNGFKINPYWIRPSVIP
jgi:KaiC/GvpD/RAD55 family RecA-like ATPase